MVNCIMLVVMFNKDDKRKKKTTNKLEGRRFTVIFKRLYTVRKLLFFLCFFPLIFSLRFD